MARTEAQLPEKSLICNSDALTLFYLPLLKDVSSSGISTWLGLLTLVPSRLAARLTVLSDSTGKANWRTSESVRLQWHIIIAVIFQWSKQLQGPLSFQEMESESPPLSRGMTYWLC